MFRFHRIAAVLGCVLLAMPALAVSHAYQLDRTGTQVTWSVDLSGSPVKGQMPVAKADLSLDFASPAQSVVNVSVDASKATSDAGFVTQAMKGPRVLDTGHTPLLAFVSRKVTGTGAGTARIEGDITIRGVTRPITLSAQLYRAQGSSEGDYKNLVIILTGALSRSAFGATGWADFVGDQVRLQIRATIHQAS